MDRKRWGRTEYIDSETGEIINAKEIKKHIYKLIRKEVTENGGYRVERKIVEIIAKQQELFN